MSLDINRFDRFDSGSALSENEFDKLENTINAIIDQAFEIPEGGKNGEVLGLKNNQISWLAHSVMPTDGVPGTVLTKTTNGYTWKATQQTGYTKEEINLGIGCNDITKVGSHINRINGLKSVSVTNAINNIINTIDKIEKDVEDLSYIVKQIGNLDNLKTDNKDNIVDALNEIFKKSGETKLQETVVVETEHVGAKRKGFLFKQGITFTQFVKLICGAGYEYDYIMPTVSIKCYSIDNFIIETSRIDDTYIFTKGLEIGSRLAFSVRSSFVKNDCGTLVSINIYEQSVSGQFNLIDTKLFDNEDSITDDTISNIWNHNLDKNATINRNMCYKLIYNYSEGAIRCDKDNLPIPGHIKAGSLELLLKIPCYYNVYYGHDDNSTLIDGQLIINGSVTRGDNSFNININATDKRFWFALPTSLIKRNMDTISNIKVTSKGMNNYDRVLDLMTELNGSTYNDIFNVEYTVFTLSRNVAFGGTDTYVVEIL